MEQGAWSRGARSFVGGGALLDRESQMPLSVSIDQGPSVPINQGLCMMHCRAPEAGMKLVEGGALLDRESQMPVPVPIDQGQGHGRPKLENEMEELC